MSASAATVLLLVRRAPRGGGDDPGDALGYDRLPDTTLTHGWMNPAGL